MTTYTEAIERVRETFDPKVRDLINEVTTDLASLGWVAERDGIALDTTSDEYQWFGPVLRRGAREVAVIVTLVEQAVREGDGEGISFTIEVGNREEKIWRSSPGNYTDRWVISVRDDEAVSDRWYEIEGEVLDLIEAVKKWTMEKSA